MTEEMLIQIVSLFIDFMAMSGSVTVLFYISSLVTNFLLGLIFPSRYGF